MSEDESRGTPLSLGRKLAFSALAVLLFFSIAEGVTRLVRPSRCTTSARIEAYLEQLQSKPGASPSSIQRSIPMPYDPFLIWHLVSNYRGNNLGVPVVHNGLGLRSPEVPFKKPADTVRVLLLGDSTIYGHGVDEQQMLRTRLEQSLSQLSSSPVVQVVNAGVPGYSSLQSLNQLRRFAMQYEPDVVVIANLWSDAMQDQFEDKTLIYGTGLKASFTRVGQGIDEALANRSALFCLLKALRSRTWSGECAPPKPLCAPPPGEVASSMLQRPAPGELANKIRAPGMGRSQGMKQRVSVDDYRQNLETMIELVRGRGAVVVFALLANQRDVGEPDDRKPTPEEYEPYRAVMREVAKQARAPLADMPAAFVAARARGASALFMDPVHPTAAGHAIMAEALLHLLQVDATTRAGLKFRVESQPYPH